MNWKWTFILSLASTTALAAGQPGKATNTDICIHYETDMYYQVPSPPLVYPNLTAQRWTYYYVCPSKVNYTFCYQTPTSFPNGNAYECQSNVAVDQDGNLDASKTVPIKAGAPIMSAAIVVKPKVTKKYYKTCSSGDVPCQKVLYKINQCMWKSEACVKTAGGIALSP